MKTSRIAKETARVAKQVTEADVVPHRQTRSFATSLQAFSANGISVLDTWNKEVKQEDSSDNDSPLSSAASIASFDIEDVITSKLPSKKRKRGVDTPATTVTSISVVTSTRTSPRKSAGNDNAGKPKKAKRQPAKRIVDGTGEVEIHPPPNWAEIYDAVKEMRKSILAPVDTMGCETLAVENISPRVMSLLTRI